MKDDITYRQVESSEGALIFSFLAIAARLAEDGEPIQKALADERLRRYWQGWGRDGDFGIAAESSESDKPVCCAWIRLYPAEAPAYGFVSEDVPELGIGAVGPARRQGIGTETLRRLIDQCRGQFPGVSLSVRRNSPAVRLYERFGFVDVADSELTEGSAVSKTMILRF